LVQINDLTDQPIDAVTQFVGTGSGAASSDLKIHHATVAMYLGYKKIPRGTEEPHVPKKLKLMQFFLHAFFLYFLYFYSTLFPFLYFSGLALYSV
jgi:hypothetical protein